MLKNKVLEIGKGLKHFMNDRIHVFKEVLSHAQNRLILGLILLGLGCGLVASAFIRVA